LAVDDTTLFTGFEGFHRLHWSLNGEQFACHAEKNHRSYLIVNAEQFGPFDAFHHADFSSDSKHWCGVVKDKEKWLVLLDGVVIDKLDYFDRVDHEFDLSTGHRFFTEDSRRCHYYGIDGKKIVYRRVEL